MLNLIKPGTTTNVLAISPLSSSLYHDTVSGSFKLNITQDYNQTSASLNLDKLAPVPQNSLGRYLLFSVTSTQIPSASGMYTYNLVEGITGTGVWANTTEQWGAADFKWNAEGAFQSDRVIDSGRVKVQGSDEVPNSYYNGGPQYGAYSTYSN